jgi:hypothetical protein
VSNELLKEMLALKEAIGGLPSLLIFNGIIELPYFFL